VIAVRFVGECHDIYSIYATFMSAVFWCGISSIGGLRKIGGNKTCRGVICIAGAATFGNFITGIKTNFTILGEPDEKVHLAVFKQRAASIDVAFKYRAAIENQNEVTKIIRQKLRLV
jgi:hypothetical protein